MIVPSENVKKISARYVSMLHLKIGPLIVVLLKILGGQVNLYHDQNLCLHPGVNADGAKDQCINPEGFSSFIGFLESIPFHDSDSNNGSSEYEVPNLRCKYLLYIDMLSYLIATNP